jgi:geranylgeranyl diphosphate synthase type II
MAGAQAAGGDAEAWRGLGERLGEAYQVADDIRDVVASPEHIGKPIGRDLALGRPSVATEKGLEAAVRIFDRQVAAAAEAIPDCRGAPMLRALVRAESERLVPRALLAHSLRAVA